MTIIPLIIKIYNIKSSVKIIREWVKLSFFLSGFLYQLPIRTSVSPQHHITMNGLLRCSLLQKDNRTLGTRLANHVHLFMTFLCNTSGSSLVCSGLNSFIFVTIFLFCCKPVAFCSELNLLTSLFPVVQKPKTDQSESILPRKVNISKHLFFNANENEAAKFTVLLTVACKLLPRRINDEIMRWTVRCAVLDKYLNFPPIFI